MQNKLYTIGNQPNHQNSIILNLSKKLRDIESTLKDFDTIQSKQFIDEFNKLRVGENPLNEGVLFWLISIYKIFGKDVDLGKKVIEAISVLIKAKPDFKNAKKSGNTPIELLTNLRDNYIDINILRSIFNERPNEAVKRLIH